MKEEQMLKGRMLDLAKRSYQQNIYTYSSFLSLSEQAVLEEIRDDLTYAHMELYGGHELAERQMVGFGSPEELGYQGEFPIVVVKVEPLLKKYSDELTHRDYLGALMNLGIERDSVGDILIREKSAYIFCANTIAPYIIEELGKIKHTNVKCEIVTVDIPDLAPRFEDVELPVASLRLDVVISSLVKCSRSESLRLFEERKVMLNGRVTGRNSISVKPGDVFSVRGYGKFIFESEGGSTRRGKIYIHIKRYV